MCNCCCRRRRRRFCCSLHSQLSFKLRNKAHTAHRRPQWQNKETKMRVRTILSLHFLFASDLRVSAMCTEMPQHRLSKIINERKIKKALLLTIADEFTAQQRRHLFSFRLLNYIRYAFHVNETHALEQMITNV